MDALILSCGTGGGHNSAGKAILEELLKRGHQATMFNPYTLKSTKLSSGIDHTYISTVQRVPDLFGAIYKIGNLYRRLPFRSPVYFSNRAMNPVMEEYLSEHPADIVIMPHLFPAEIMTNMKKHGLPVPKTMFVATDYVCIPFTEETECDAYVIPAADLAESFTAKGLPEEKLHPLGIPVSHAFVSGEPKEAVRAQLGLEPDKKYVLIAGGSMGGGKIEKTVELLSEHFKDRADTELIIICGNNQELYQKLAKQETAGIQVMSYTDRMADYMRASNLFVTKPGGLSSTEAAVCNVPILHTATIPGCESHNADYFCSHGMSLSGELTEDILAQIDRVLQDETCAQKMIQCQRKWINPNAAADICDLAELLVG